MKSKIDALLASLWERGLPLLRERLDILDRAATAAALGEMTEALRTEAVGIAHNFSGSLGMFGYDHGTEIARKIEQLLCASKLTVSGSFSALVTELRETLHVK
jgi:HPt (histidine-containing phosphotransfer) domain-containing protein